MSPGPARRNMPGYFSQVIITINDATHVMQHITINQRCSNTTQFCGTNTRLRELRTKQPESMTYSLGTQCLTEFLGTLTAIYFGEAILANELLPKTKGHAVGFGWVALGFAFSFSFGIFLFTNVSAHLNPAFCLTLWINGIINGTAFVALSAANSQELSWERFLFGFSICLISKLFLNLLLIKVISNRGANSLELIFQVR